MSSVPRPGEEDWRRQMRDMKAAASKLDSSALYDQRRLDENALPSDDDSPYSSGEETTIWDFVDEEDLQRYGEELFETPPPEPQAIKETGIYSQDWLQLKALEFEQKSSIDACDLFQQLNTALASTLSNEDLQAALTDIVGYDDFDLIIDLIGHRKEILKPSQTISDPTRGFTDGILGKLQTKKEREAALRAQDVVHKSAKLAPALSREEPKYPHVYKTYDAAHTLSMSGKKYSLPVGSERTEREKYTEHSIPASKVGVLAKGQQLVEISGMDDLCVRTFQGYKTLNRMQSLVYPVAYGTNENMLICAPTGAGKTDAAMLAILHTIAQNTSPRPKFGQSDTNFRVSLDDFKIVYVAPMKALAAEITEKIGKRLAWLGVRVRELTGDMHLTKREILETQILVTTPEKWDVVTRKSTGDTELVQKVRLLIIDEVHMLHDERGAVIESLVARTQRQVESTQSLIRILGLSATLPNFVDVADFLKVNRMAGLFYFDASFRPVPLEQHFIGVKGKAGTRTSRENLDTVAYEKVVEMLGRGHQVMVFVHSRKDTFNTAKMIYQKAVDQGRTDLFTAEDSNKYASAAKDMSKTRAKEIRELFSKAMGTHHAGMARSDRNLVERLFADGVLRVLCCTATLAWGVNLPAAAVIIKGTQLYSAQEGKFVDLGILDVLQIFGRAGRPQFQDTGIGFICTTQDKLDHYLSAVTQQQPIESKFSSRLADNLNAEIALGTVTSVAEAIQWLGYSYLYVRMKKEPRNYGIDWAEIRDDTHLVQRRQEIVIAAARTLRRSQMIIFNESTGELRSKDVGRIASQYYVQQSTIELFNRQMQPRASEADILSMLSLSGEFDNIQSRDNEQAELQALKENDSIVPCGMKGAVTERDVKTNVLLQSYISRARLEDFTLSSDAAYVAQNSARICRALFHIALNRRWGHQCQVLLALCQSVEKQIWPYQHPFHQFDLPKPILDNLDSKGITTSIESLREMEAAEIGALVHNHRMGGVLSKILSSFPTLTVEAEIAPLNRDVLRIHLYITPEFEWNDRHNGTSESYWIWVENSDTSEIYHHEFFILTKRKLLDDHELHFTIPLSDPLPSQIYVRAISDRWLGAEAVTPVSFKHLIRPDTESFYTDLLDLQPLPITALKNPSLEHIYGEKFQFFNPMQTQIFHCLYNTPANVLLGSPTGSGKTIASELAMWWAFREKPGSKVVYIAPMKALVRERVQDWGKRLTRQMGLKLVELTGDNTPDTKTIRDADIIITTPEKWDGISRSWQTRNYVRQVSLVVIDEIHLLGGDRGPILEIIVSRMNYIAAHSNNPVRLVGMSTACANASDLGNWLGVKEGLFNFRHSVRPVPLEIYIDGFPEQRGFCALMQSMNRPTFLAIKTHSPAKPVIVFVASRRQTRLTAKDLINFCGMEDNPRRFLHMSEEDLQVNLTRAKDESLKEALSFGIGLHHAGLVESDRSLSEELFANNKVQILVATSTLAWGVNLPAHLVVVKGTQFFDAKIEGYKDIDLTDVLQMLGRAGRPQFDTSGIAKIFTQDAKKEFYKHFLHTGFPVESTLHQVLDNHFAAEISAGTIATKQDALDYLTWTFFFRRLHKNPSYYGLEITADEQNSSEALVLANDFMIDLVETSLDELSQSRCITSHPSGDVDSTPLGKIMSYYYLSHKTVRYLVHHAKDHASFAEALKWMSNATEYDELPVRHNEDLINTELSRNLPIDATNFDMPMWDPHVKAFLLLQAFMSRVDLPISDYVTDQNSVLDQSIRIIQASIDILAELNHLKSCKMMITLLQCLKSARWPTDGPLSIFPGIEPSQEKQRLSANPSSPSTLLQAIRLPAPKRQSLLNTLDLPQPLRPRFLSLLKTLPDLRVSTSEVSTTSVKVSIARTAPMQHSQGRMHAPRFPKPQSEGWFVLLIDPKGAGQLLALKRLGWPTPLPNRGELTARAVLKIEQAAEDRVLDVAVVSDGYIGLEFWCKGVEVPAAPKVGPDNGKKPGVEMEL
ncbi:MAG: hypothetical protein M1814_005978 [Vezdaea aestivalis]|nr:MAG: hypothetical protein M1814_005978 [Vezdaea aestivalis]